MNKVGRPVQGSGICLSLFLCIKFILEGLPTLF